MIEKITDVKLNVRPVFIGLVHQYYYEGPCRFGKDEELEKDYDVFRTPSYTVSSRKMLQKICHWTQSI